MAFRLLWSFTYGSVPTPFQRGQGGLASGVSKHAPSVLLLRPHFLSRVSIWKFSIVGAACKADDLHHMAVDDHTFTPATTHYI